DGDMSQEAKLLSRDEMGELTNAINSGVKGIRSILLKTRELSMKVDDVAGDIDRLANDVEGTSKGQEGNINSIVASVEGLHESIKEILKNVEQLLILSEGTSSFVLEMAASIEEVDKNVADLTTAIGETSTSIEEIATSLMEVSKGINDLSSTADGAASSIMEIDTAIMEIEERSKEGVALSQAVAQEGEKGVKTVQVVHHGMEEIKGVAITLSGVMEELGKGSKNIGRILSVIDDVADETNLLALNAAILAAQAGEHGKGFGIVADEIRELAERTSASTKEIAEIISGIQTQVAMARRFVEDGLTKVKEGEGFSMDAMKSLEDILERFKSSQEMSLQIAKATEEQVKGTKQVTQAIESVTDTIHQIARAVEEQSQGSQQILKAVERMKDLSSHIKRATAEQADGSKIIASNTERVLNSIHSISNTTIIQERNSREIVALAEGSKRLVDESIGRVKGLKEVVTTLRKEVETLGMEIGKFRLEA
ncbi:MAG: hypothetical protein HY878_04665, partial [Deltaproteobacteria bacterium]|nr:hypothetical protein [Deltaproteobacteria bacterium]